MRRPLVELNMMNEEKIDVVQAPGAGNQPELEIQNNRLAEALRKEEFRTAIEASTARILSIALTRGTFDPDPEAA
ncbi:MAG TPA: hypothetical protein VN972_01840 [Methylomirabilota bacterium]|nr:hypothetical protein [Methylomirabilota bacterium]